MNDRGAIRRSNEVLRSCSRLGDDWEESGKRMKVGMHRSVMH